MNKPHIPSSSIILRQRLVEDMTIDRPGLSRKLLRAPYPRKLPTVLSPEEVVRLLAATTCTTHRAALAWPMARACGLRKWPSSR
jgi:integrase/recombinase XerD